MHDHVSQEVAHLRDATDVTFVGSTEFDAQIQLFAYDPESGIIASEWCLGSFPGACDVFRPTPVDFRIQLASASVTGLIDGVTYFAYLAVTNGAGNYLERATNGFR